jgi:hypothetical protein
MTLIYSTTAPKDMLFFDSFKICTNANNAGKINKLVMVFAFHFYSHDCFVMGDKSGPRQYC